MSNNTILKNYSESEQMTAWFILLWTIVNTNENIHSEVKKIVESLDNISDPNLIGSKFLIKDMLAKSLDENLAFDNPDDS